MSNPSGQLLEQEREQKAATMCICRACPTYKALGKQDDHISYCLPSFKRSKNITTEKGCMCGICPVYPMYQFMTNYYCTRGTEQEQKQAIAQEAQTGRSALEITKHKA